MRVVNCCYDDYANYSFDNAKALASVGVDAESFNTIKSLFGYESSGKVISKEQFKKQMLEADIIQIMHSSELMLGYVKELFLDNISLAKMKQKKIIVYHTGTVYRNEPEKYNQNFNPIIYRAITDQCEFMNLGAKDVAYLATAVDTDKIVPVQYKKEQVPVIAHYPSNIVVKGSSEILMMLQKINKSKFILNYSDYRVPNKEQLDRIGMCDIYVEMFKPILNGKPYGCYGVTAFEASALGKIVVTNNIYEQVYENTYGECPFFIANTEEEFIATINHLVSLNRDQLDELQNESRQWVVKNHSYKATGERMKQLLGI